MEAHEISELQENQEHGSEAGLQHVSFTMSVLAVLLAMTTVLGHRTHTEAVLQQSRVSDQWNFYQARKARANAAANTASLVAAMQSRDEGKAQAFEQAQKQYAAGEQEKAEGERSRAEALEARVDMEERRASRFDLGEALLQIGVIITSITLLTRKPIYWQMGMFFGAGGIIAAVLAFFVH